MEAILSLAVTGGERVRRLWHKAHLVRWAFLPFGGGSLRHETKSLLPMSRTARLAGLRRTAVRVASRLGPVPYLALIAVVGLPLCDVDWGVLGDPEESKRYLHTLWQVVAASLALSVAMIGFVFEAFANAARRSLGGSLREFTRTIWLNATLRLGFAALICNGVVLLEIGHEAPGGWAALWAIFLSAITLGVALPIVFGNTLKALDLDYLIEMQTREVDDLVKRTMEHQLRGQAGDMLLERMYKDHGVARGLWVGDEQQEGIPGTNSRVLFDVRIDRMLRLAETIPGDGDGDDGTRRARVEILASLHDAVSERSPLISVPTGQGTLWKRSVRRAVKLRRRRDGDRAAQLLGERLNALHEAALAAIREHRRGDWMKISEIYSRALLALPKTTAEMGVPFEGAVASPGIMRPLGPLDRIERFLDAEVVAALDTDDGALARDVAYFPVGIAGDAAHLNAAGLVRAMLAIYPRLYRATVTARDEVTSRSRALLRQRSHTHLVEWLRYTAIPAMRDGLTASERESGLELVKIALHQLNLLLRLAIDARDVSTFEEVAREWGLALDEPYEIGAVDDVTRAALRERDRLTCGLAMWAAHLLSKATDSSDRDALGSMFRTTGDALGSPESVAAALELALSEDELWSDWFLAELPSNQVYSIPTREKLLRTALLLAARLDPLDPARPPFPNELLLYRADDLVQDIRRLAEDPGRWSVVLAQPGESDELGGPDLETDGTAVPDLDAATVEGDFLARLERLEAYVRAAEKAADDRRRSDLRAAVVAQEKLDAFRTIVVDGIRTRRVVRDLLELDGAVRRGDEPDDPGWLGRSDWIPKRWFIDTNYVGLDRLGHDFGRTFHREEVRQLTDALSDADVVAAGDDIQGDGAPDGGQHALGRLRSVADSHADFLGAAATARQDRHRRGRPSPCPRHASQGVRGALR